MKKQVCALLATLLLLAGLAWGQGWNVELVSTKCQNWGDAAVIVHQGNYAYMGISGGIGGISVMDISDPADPFEVAFMPLGETVIDVEISGNYLYVVLSGLGFKILDVSNPRNPVEITHWCMPQYEVTADIAVAGDLACIIHYPDGPPPRFTTLDISDPTNPIQLGQYTFQQDMTGKMAINGDYAYVPRDLGGLWVLDISDPTRPALAGSIFGFYGNSHDVAVSGNVAYLPVTVNGLYVIDVSNPANLQVLANLREPDYIYSIEISGANLYLGTIYEGLSIVDVSQPSNPVLLGHCGVISEEIRDMAPDEPYVYCAWDYDGLRVINAADPMNPTMLSCCKPDWWIGDVVWRDNYAYLAAGSDGLLIYDVSDPDNPWQAGYTNDIGSIIDLLLWGNYAYAQTWSEGLKIVDISDPSHPALAGTYNLQNGAVHKIMNNLAYASSDGDLKILDLSSPLNPVQIGTFSPNSGDIWALDTDGQFLFATVDYPYDYSWIDSLLVLDVRNPANPQFIGLYPLGEPNNSHLLMLGDGYLYVVGLDFGFRIYDVSSPANPTVVGSLAMQGSASDLVLFENFVYLTSDGYTMGLQVIDISDPTNPTLAGYYDTPGSTQAVAVNGDYAYIADWGCFEIYDCSDATHNGVEVTITPLIQPIQIPASGGSFDFYLFADNSGPGNQMVDLWTKIILPGGSVICPILGPVSVSLDSGTTGWIRHQNVPERAAAGLYTYIACTGDYPGSIWASDSLQFTKLALGDWGPGSGDWSNTGESLEFANDEFIIPNSSFIIFVRPNPFNPTTAISFELRDASFVKLTIYDISGRLVAPLVDGWQEAGVHEVTFDGSGLPSGIYMARLRAGDYTQVQKMILMK